MPIPPLLHALVEIDEPFAELGVLGVLPVHLHEDLLQLRRRLHRRDHVAGEQRRRHAVFLARQIPQKAIPQRRLVIAALERHARAAALRKALDRLLGFHAEQEFDLPELIGLKPARRFQPQPEAEELERRHGFQDVELRDHHLENRQDPLERVLRLVRLIVFEQPPHAIEFVQQLLEPQLVDLVDDDEQHFVVFGPLRTRLLQRQQLVDLQIAAVGDGRL